MTTPSRLAEPCLEPSPWREALHASDDALARLLGSRGAPPALGQDLSRGPVLELARVWMGTLMEVRHVQRGALRLGLGADELPADPAELGAASFTLLRMDEARGALARLRPAWRVTLRREGRALDLDALQAEGRVQADDEGALELALAPGEQLAVDVGAQVLLARLVHAPARVLARPAPEQGLVASLAGSAFLGAIFSVLALTQPPPSDSEVFEIPDRFARVMLQAPPPRDPTPLAPRAEAEPAAKAARKEGKRGERDALQQRARGDAEAMRQDRQIAEEAGILGRLSASGALERLLDGGGLNAGAGPGKGLIGAKGQQMGSGGMSSRGDGLGGGGDAYSLGGPGTRGRDEGYGQEGGDLGDKKEGGSISAPGGLIVGGLDRAQVDAVIKRNLARFRYCYQRELTRDPSLGGKVVVKFVIGQDGSVSAADIKASSLANDAVESCLVRTTMSLGFPQPKGNGIVMVSYPFLFAPG